MLRYSCDICGRDIVACDDTRYVVKIEVNAAADPAEMTEADLDCDPIESLSQLLHDEGVEADLSDDIAPLQKSFRYDLCSVCHKKYVRNPLTRDADKAFQFSKN